MYPNPYGPGYEADEFSPEPEPRRVLTNGRVDGLYHTCEGTSREQECRVCDIEQAVEEASQFDPNEWVTTPETVGAP